MAALVVGTYKQRRSNSVTRLASLLSALNLATPPPPSATSGLVLYWSWFKPQAEVKSFPAEPMKPLAANSEGKIIKNVFPSIIDAIVLDPGELVFYGGSRDGKIYIAALDAESSPGSSYRLHIIVHYLMTVSPFLAWHIVQKEICYYPDQRMAWSEFGL
ncbi:hypothetical protein DITRI_Ditri10aG0044100 [Diplodiscus trichospermus]